MTTSRFRIRTSPPENLTEAKLCIEECVRNRNEVLNLEDLNLTQLPEDVGSLTWLTQLWLSRNYISEVPEFIGQLKKIGHAYSPGESDPPASGNIVSA